MRSVPIIIRLLLATLALALPVSALAGSGIQGRAAWRGVLVPDVQVRAYRSVEDIARGKVVATSAASALDGTYRLELTPGQYFLTAQDFTGTPRPDNHFCYYSA